MREWLWIGGDDWRLWWAGGLRAKVSGTGVAPGGRDLAAMEQAKGGTGDKVQALPDRGCGLLGTCMRSVMMRAAVGFRTAKAELWCSGWAPVGGLMLYHGGLLCKVNGMYSINGCKRRDTYPQLYVCHHGFRTNIEP